MSKVITFSRVFPKYHPRVGEPTYFVEKIWKYFLNESSPMFPYWMKNHPSGTDIRDSYDYEPKMHTIRAGNRWKVGEKFSPRLWSGKPYCSKQVIIAPDIEIKKVWDIKLEITLSLAFTFWINNRNIKTNEVVELAKNDGLSVEDFLKWFAVHPKNHADIFDGQIICWDENINH